MSFAIELLRRHFGNEVLNHTATVDLRFLRTVRPGDTITYTATVTGVSREVNGSHVPVEIKAENQRSETATLRNSSAAIRPGFHGTGRA